MKPTTKMFMNRHMLINVLETMIVIGQSSDLEPEFKYKYG